MKFWDKNNEDIGDSSILNTFKIKKIYKNANVFRLV